jgi:hypothetical protein
MTTAFVSQAAAGAALRNVTRSGIAGAPNRPSRRPARWTCREPPHPYGNGGLNNVANWEGYSREAAIAEGKRLQEEYDRDLVEHEAAHKSMWTMIFNTDLIQWNNNLAKCAMEFGLDMTFDGARVVSISETIAQTLVEGTMDKLWVLRGDDGQSPYFITAYEKTCGPLLLTWEHEDDARRFCNNLSEDGVGDAAPILLPLPDIKLECAERSMRIGFITPSFVQPSHFQPGPITRLA